MYFGEWPTRHTHLLMSMPSVPTNPQYHFCGFIFLCSDRGTQEHWILAPNTEAAFYNIYKEGVQEKLSGYSQGNATRHQNEVKSLLIQGYMSLSGSALLKLMKIGISATILDHQPLSHIREEKDC